MAMAVLPLAIQIVPLIPGLIADILNVVHVIKNHPTTPDDVKAQLDQIAVELDAVNARVQAVVLPT